MSDQFSILCDKIDRIERKLDEALNDTPGGRGLRTRVALLEEFTRRIGRLTWIVITCALTAVVGAVVSVVGGVR